MQPVVSRPCSRLEGRISVPGDKSISHRALILGACAVGETTVSGLLEAEDVMATAAAMRILGARVDQCGGRWRICGRGIGGLVEPDRVLDLGNSGTGVRLIMGLVASHPFTTFFSGDPSLSDRPMTRVIDPLSRIGATFWSRRGGRLPLAVRGTETPVPITYHLPVASAQVKSAILLAALNTPGRTTVVEPNPSRDHTELMLRRFGVDVEVESLSDGGRRISLTGHPEIGGCDLTVPGDISSAAFPLVAALARPGSEVTLAGVGVNRLRSGLLQTLSEMGARMTLANRQTCGHEPTADIVVQGSSLRGVVVPGERVPAMIDEFPVVAAAAACATGETRMQGLSELRVKESDRLTAMADGLRACGVHVEHGEDWLVIHGTGAPPRGGARIAVRLDHRIAMSFLVLGMVSKEPVEIDDAAAISTSFPGFVALMNGLGAHIEPASSS